MTESLRHTPLYAWHQQAGARLVPFAGWEMPVQFSGVVDEHTAVRSAAGLFDVSHMGEIEVVGGDALDFLQWMTPNNVARLQDGQAHYSALLREDGTFIDDLLVYRFGEKKFMLVVNAANTARDLEWLTQHVEGDVQLSDQSDNFALLALQGPAAADILLRLAPSEVADLKYYRFMSCDFGFGETVISRTGYTGEDGFELYVGSDRAVSLWEKIIEEGGEQGVKPIGLGARDTLRLEAGMLLSGQDMGAETTPLEVGLSWIVKFKKGDFIGRSVLVEQQKQGVKKCTVAFELNGRRPARPGSVVMSGGRKVGDVTSGTWSPSLERPIGLALVDAGTQGRSWSPGETIEIDVRGKRCEGLIVELPFVRRS